jgi:hypothetical protein
MSYKEIARELGSMSASRARQRALQGFRDEAKQLGKRYYHLKHDSHFNWIKNPGRD